MAKYEEEMASELCGEEPLEEAIPEEDSVQSRPTLMGLHESIFPVKHQILVEKVVQMLPRSSESPTSPCRPEEREDVRGVISHGGRGEASRLGSTVVDLSHTGSFSIIRPGMCVGTFIHAFVHCA